MRRAAKVQRPPLPTLAQRELHDLTYGELALSEAELRARVVDLEGERDAYRELLQAALSELHVLTTKHERLLSVHRELRERFRAEQDEPVAGEWMRDGADVCTERLAV